MTKNAFMNALAAMGYIAAVVLFVQYGVMAVIPQETLLIPVAMLSLLVLSVAVMGYLFFYQPARMYVDGDKEGAVRFFLSTLGTFAALAAILLVVAFFVLQTPKLA